MTPVSAQRSRVGTPCRLVLVERWIRGTDARERERGRATLDRVCVCVYMYAVLTVRPVNRLPAYLGLQKCEMRVS